MADQNLPNEWFSTWKPNKTKKENKNIEECGVVRAVPVTGTWPCACVGTDAAHTTYTMHIHMTREQTNENKTWKKRYVCRTTMETDGSFLWMSIERYANRRLTLKFFFIIINRVSIFFSIKRFQCILMGMNTWGLCVRSPYVHRVILNFSLNASRFHIMKFRAPKIFINRFRG